ncbi:MAG: O-antigen ligase family protein [Eubacteriales bacterium]|nr:O-antigen ligase family protein [Eubacteriales bacterium]
MEKRFLCFMLYLLPFIDSINGFLIQSVGINLSVGVAYRLFLFFSLALCMFTAKMDMTVLKNTILLAVCLFSSVLFHFEGNRIDEILDISKIILFPLLFLVISAYMKEDSVFAKKMKKIFHWYAVAFPLTLIIPYFLGVGYSSYENNTGYRGFYIALNAISSVIILTCVYSFYLMIRKTGVFNCIVFLMNLFCAFTLGTKSAYLIIAVSIVVITLGDIIFRQAVRMDIIRIAALGIIAVALIVVKEWELILSIVDRWQYFFKSKSFISFMTSDRADRIVPAMKYIMRSEYRPFYLLFGYGLIPGSEKFEYPLMEMDFFDIFYLYGIINFVLVCALVVNIFRKSPRDKNVIFKYLYFLTVLIAFWVGHVFTNALSVMVFAFIAAFMCYDRDGIIKNENATVMKKTTYVTRNKETS